MSKFGRVGGRWEVGSENSPSLNLLAGGSEVIEW